MVLLTRRELLRRTVCGAAGMGAIGLGLPVPAGSSPSVSREIESLCNRSLTGDSLVYTEDYSPALDAETLRAIRESGMTYAFYDVSITPAGRSFENCYRSVTLWNQSVSRHRDTVLLADTAADILRAKREEKHAMVFLFQDTYPLEYDLSRIGLFYGLGVRVMQLTHNVRNLVGDGYVERVNGGLSTFGYDVVRELNQRRMLIDLSHCGERTTMEAIRHSTRPCAFTHVGCRSILATERNKTDAQIRALADKGGVIGIFNMTCWLTEDDRASVEAVVAHIIHAVSVAGIDHVGFGSDGPMGGVQRLAEELAGHVQFFQSNLVRSIYVRRPSHVRVPELNEPRRLVVLADALARKGYGEAAIEKIIGGNFFRLLGEVIG